MIKDKKVSLWLGTFSSGEEFNEAEVTEIYVE